MRDRPKGPHYGPVAPILVIGASGFLGREVTRVLSAGADVVGWGRSGRDGSRAMDIRDPTALRAAVAGVRPSAVILLAAYRDPDACEADPGEARRLNVEPARVLRDALPAATPLLFVSTDYVFDGERPPYTEESPRSPVSVYGQTKCEAEDALAGRPGAAVLRVPLLVGGGASLRESGFIGQMVDAVSGGREQVLDDVLVRFPTWTRDVAGALRFLLERRADGVFHLSGPRGGTRYGWTVEMARLLGRPHGHLKPSKVVVQRGARRPANSQLADDKLRALGYSPRTDFSDVARAVLRELDA